MGAVLMVQGTSSDAGKSIFCAALCRYLAQEGYSVAPFKAQNMALNAMAVDGGEIGWAQVMQAEAAGVEPDVLMNPVLLKPVTDTHCQVVVNGRSIGNMSASAYQEEKKALFNDVLTALDTLREQYDVVVIEGAGSPAEVNLREHDIVNMRLAQAANAPVLLISDIDRGGMFAYVAGTLALLTESELERVKGIVVNRFRGIKERLQPGLEMLEERVHKPVIGVIPHLDELSLPAEDSLSLGQATVGEGELDVAVIQLPRIANFTDYHALATEAGVRLRYVQRAEQLGKPHLIVLPGTKNTISDLSWLKKSGLASAIATAASQGTYIAGICGGYQMLGEQITDKHCADGSGGSEGGLAMLPVRTEFSPDKTTIRVTGKTVKYNEELSGYEIHMGRTTNTGAEPFALLCTTEVQSYEDGAVSADGRILGTYLHGLFDSAPFRHGFLNRVRQAFGLKPQAEDKLSARQKRELSYQLLAKAVREHTDCDLIRSLVNEQL